MGATTFRVMLRMNVKPGAETDYERTWLEVGQAITGHPANLGQWLLRADGEDNVYFIVSDWTDEASFREFERSDAHVAHRTKLHPYRTGGEMWTMRLVHEMNKGARR